MSKSSADRKATVNALRKQANVAEQLRSYGVVILCVVVALVIVAAAAYKPVSNWWHLRQFNDVSLQSIGAPASVCGTPTTQPGVANPQHVPTGQQVTYTTAPPAFGSHWNEQGVAPVAMSRKFYSPADRPALEALVHNLEHGYTLLWYDATVASNKKLMDEIQAIGRKFPGDTNFRYKFIAVPWLASDAKQIGKDFPSGQHVAFTHWSGQGAAAGSSTDGSEGTGVFEYCSTVSGAGLKTFMQKYPYTDSPEPTAM